MTELTVPTIPTIGDLETVDDYNTAIDAMLKCYEEQKQLVVDLQSEGEQYLADYADAVAFNIEVTIRELALNRDRLQDKNDNFIVWMWIMPVLLAITVALAASANMHW